MSYTSSFQGNYIDNFLSQSYATTATQQQQDTQINQLQSNLSNILNEVYPVGSVYISINNTSPATLFGGTWVRIESKYLYANAPANDHVIGETFGAWTHTHSLPSHTHTSAAHKHNQGDLSALIGSAANNANSLGFKLALNNGGPKDGDYQSIYSVGGNSSSASGHPVRAHNTMVYGNTGSTTPGATGTWSGTSGSGPNEPPAIRLAVWYRTK